jgi:hypothetical protein
MKFRGEWYWEHPLSGIIAESSLFIALVGLLWYLVAVEVSGRGQSVLTSKVRFRSLADVSAMLFGGGLLIMGLNIYWHEFGFPTAYSAAVAIPYIMWALVVVLFYGHDLLVHSRSKQ